MPNKNIQQNIQQNGQQNIENRSELSMKTAVGISHGHMTADGIRFSGIATLLASSLICA